METALRTHFSVNMFDYSPIAFCVIRVELDAQGQPEDWTFAYCNDALAELEGLPKEQLLGQRFFRLFPDGDRKWLKPYYAAAYEGTPSDYEEISEARGLYLHIYVMPINERGYCACLLKNVRAETFAADNQNNIIMSMAKIYYATYYVNLNTDSFLEISSTSRIRQALGETGDAQKTFDIVCEQLIEPAFADEMREFTRLDTLNARLKGKTAITHQFIDRIRGWSEALFIAGDTNPDGTLRHAFYAVRTIHDEKEKEFSQQKALRDALATAEHANAAKSDFLSSMSHDIRTPMNGIIGMTAIAAAHCDDPERVRDSLMKITSASKHLLSLINEVLDMSKIESGKVDLAEEPFNLSELVDNLLAMTRPQIAEKHHTLSVNIDDVRHENVIGDSLRVQQVFVNLIGNAIKYTPDGGKIRLTISEKPSNQNKIGCYEFVFEDNGIGMSAEYIQHVFEPFSRARDARVSNVQGTGLGLSIARNIVRRMGGDIRVTSTPNVGTRFTVTMYLRLQDTNLTPSDKLVNLDVLVADDDPLSLESCCDMLDSFGMKTVGVPCGQEAVTQVAAHHRDKRDFFACILDWQMPDLNGIETARAIRREVGNDVPIIIVSAYDWSDIEQEARAAGVNDFISKPYFRSKLAHMFNRLAGAEEEAPAPEASEALTETQYTGRRVLLVEDNQLNSEIAAELLKMSGLTVDCAWDGIEAVDCLTNCPDGYYDMVFMDIQMPRMNGYDATRAIRSSARDYCKRVPIVAMTANAFAEDVQAAKTVGMNEHIAKPLELPTLAAVLRRYLG